MSVRSRTVKHTWLYPSRHPRTAAPRGCAVVPLVHVVLLTNRRG
ncbi:hypothetical protein STVIR_6428 [Streptomyces viridochromogenes Tue57]|uniref:Uncharacterized protein n=1 Tax=Streptomyces viridochromogenes Tue57 TaxID=1160705 RepID=L8PBE1_STRVR|nr:hypothetical protein STVIR_6428 [Streptomyces viridochromogenes Tue57]